MYHLTFLGTSAGIPTKQRNVTALAVECVNPYLSGDKVKSKKSRPWLLIDCGEGTQHQLLRTKLSGHNLAAICITHVHGDHCYGLPGLLASLAMSGRTQPLTIIAPKAISILLDTLTVTTELHFTYPIEFIAIEEVLAVTEKASDAAVNSAQHNNNPADKAHPIILNFSATQQLTIEIIPLSHRVASHAFVLTQRLTINKLNTDKLRADNIAAGKTWGMLQRGLDVTLENGEVLKSAEYVEQDVEVTKIIVAGDNDTPSLLAEAASDAVLVVHEGTYTESVLAKIQAKLTNNDSSSDIDPMHSTAAQVAKFAENTGVPNLILTHFSARYQGYDDASSDTPNMADIRVEAEQHYHGNLWLAKDFAQFTVADKVKRVEE
jgi:ribonuclease Z